MISTVGKKLWSGFLSILVIMIIVGVIGLWAIFSTSKEYRFLIDDRMKKVVLFEQLLKNQNENSNALRGYLLYNNDDYITSLSEINTSFDTIMAELDSIVRTKSARVILNKIKETAINYKENTDLVVSEFKKDKIEEIVEIATEGAVYQDTITEGIKQLIEHQNIQRNKTEQELDSFLQWIRMLIVGLIVLATAVSIIIARSISLSIAHPVSKMTVALKQIAKGDFSIESVNIRNKDEIGEMAIAFNGMASDLRGIITNTRDSAVQFAVQAEQLSASSEESLAASEMVAEITERSQIASEKQVSIAKDSSTSMNKMATGIDRITGDNEAMLLTSEEVVHLVGEGATLMKDFTHQMTTISSTIGQSVGIISEMANQSEKIRRVTSLITDIAVQTNLLALNAAIEAARAGEQGKGFAVVAEEVRNLAEQSKQSAEEIGRVIDTIILNVRQAVSSTEDGNNKVKEGLVVTKKTSAVFNQIEHAAHEVSEKVEMVSAAIEQIRKMTVEVSSGAVRVQELAIETSTEAQSTSAATEQQLAANEEISSSAQTLAELAVKLQNDMARFKV
ncbi:methyl-accepting chemotaxis protein [Sporosarcina limicola]|uniref:Methyl-accepting chemotaxis protein n=1 Tax=Sporosarcina limicola TaxID=34101 RepID=A0A927MQ32_9BACL|nr:methyl-accepting chemotaxis protein [Sporosarcina limicola]MBE1555296.1 methyl-accepting chemotaxis protein [Sporosarcina limicola]